MCVNWCRRLAITNSLFVFGNAKSGTATTNKSHQTSNSCTSQAKKINTKVWMPFRPKGSDRRVWGWNNWLFEGPAAKVQDQLELSKIP